MIIWDAKTDIYVPTNVRIIPTFGAIRKVIIWSIFRFNCSNILKTKHLNCQIKVTG